MQINRQVQRVPRAGTPMPYIAIPDDDELALVFLTSGSTGKPKLVPKTFSQFRRQMRVEPAFLGVPQAPSVLSMVPPFHILGFMYGTFLPLISCGRAIFCGNATPYGWAKAITRFRPHLVVGVPAHYRLLAQVAQTPFPPAIYLCSGGPLPTDCEASFTEVCKQSITQVYGSTENGGIAIRREGGPWQPFPELTWRIAGGGREGRLEVMSPWQQTPNRWTPTDDLARQEGDQVLILGRLDSVIKIGGRRLSLQEILSVAQEHPDVEEAIVLPYERYAEQAVALFACPKKDRQLAPWELKSFLGQRLAKYKLPRTVRVLEALPTTSIGKIDRQRLLSTLR
ncbi:MAG: fatty acid--CoA ligase family protein [Acidobacteriota bacterium]|nr:fatty acid--CoA ligase family protein [Acidobacteriota bacterium]